MPDILAANEQANAPITRSMDRNKGGEPFMRIKDHSLASSVQDATLPVNSHSQKKSEGFIIGDNAANRTSFHNYKQNRMFYYNHARDDATRGGRPADLNHSLNFAQNNRTHADNFISGQNHYNATLSQLTDRTGQGVIQLSQGGHQQPAHMGHRQQRSQLAKHNATRPGHNQIYYNESLRDQNHMSLPYLNETRSSRQGRMSNPYKAGNAQNRPRDLQLNMMVPLTEEARTLEVRPISNPSQMQNLDAQSVSRNGRPQPQYSVEHSDVINRMNSDGSTVSEIHHHVHHHYNHTHIHHHHNEAAQTAQQFVMGGAAVPPAGVSTHQLDPSAQQQKSSQ